MDKRELISIAEDICERSETNYLGAFSGSDEDISPEEKIGDNNFVKNNLYAGAKNADLANSEDYHGCAGMRFFGVPVMSFGSADDPGFLLIKDPELVGSHHLLPHDWLPEAKTVISVFVPYSDRVLDSNKAEPVEPSREWLYTRVDGQKHLLALGAGIKSALIRSGQKAVAPYTEDGYIMRPGPAVIPGSEDVPVYSTNWSERHVAYVTGLGTFGISTNFISKIGSAGRLISIITDLELEPDKKDYIGWLDYCNRCGACRRRCPAGAYTTETGKDHSLCGEHIGRTCKKYAPRYGCGKCQSAVPCERKPMRS